MTPPWIRDPRSAEQIAAEFWTEQRAKRERRKEIAAMPRKLERFDAILRDVWTPSALKGLSMFHRYPFAPLTADALDEWLAEDERVPQVAEALLQSRRRRTR